MTDDPDHPTTIGGWIRSFLLGRLLEAGYTDQAAIDRDYARMVAASDARDAQFWADMRAAGVPVAGPEPGPEPGSFGDRYAAAVAGAQADQWVAGHTPAAEVSAAAPAWEQLRADGAPAAQPQTEPEIPPARVPADPEPEAEL